MQLSKEIQERLNSLDSNIHLAKTIEGILPDSYAFLAKQGRSFRAEFGSSEKEYSVILFERTDELKYENCVARGIFSDLSRLARVIDQWVSHGKDIFEIKSKFDELELFQDFDFKNPNPEIDKAWTKVKNKLFNDIQFWNRSEWNIRYLEMLTEAKRNKAFQTYFPFTSHYWLRFSIDKDIKETWVLDLYIVPTIYSKEVPESLGQFYVSYNEKPMGGKFFERITDALDFYANQMLEKKPIKWVKEK